MVVTNDAQLAERAAFLRDHARIRGGATTIRRSASTTA